MSEHGLCLSLLFSLFCHKTDSSSDSSRYTLRLGGYGREGNSLLNMYTDHHLHYSQVRETESESLHRLDISTVPFSNNRDLTRDESLKSELKVQV